MKRFDQYNPDTSVEKGWQALRQRIDAQVSSAFTSCVHCGLCADACHFYAETGDPRYTPIYKLRPLRKLWQREHTLSGKVSAWLGLGEALGEADFAEWETLVYDSCTLCGRCGLACPLGVDIPALLRKQRTGFNAAGYAPEGLKGATKRAVETGSPMSVTWKALSAQIRHIEAETGLPIPVDQSDVQYLVMLSSLEIMGFPEYLASIARIFDHAGIAWTLSSQAFEATNSGVQIGDDDVARELLQRVFDTATELGVSHIISPECGHAYTAIRWESANLLGHDIPFEIVHIVELLDQLQREGRLHTEGKIDTHLTFHDPCDLVRKGGVVEEPRRILNRVADDFVESPDCGVTNWCCGGGGGVSANERAEDLRLAAFRRKKSQFEELGVSAVVTACANCRNVLEEGLEHYEMDIEVLGLTELVAGHLVSEKTGTETP